MNQYHNTKNDFHCHRQRSKLASKVLITALLWKILTMLCGILRYVMP